MIGPDRVQYVDETENLRTYYSHEISGANTGLHEDDESESDAVYERPAVLPQPVYHPAEYSASTTVLPIDHQKIEANLAAIDPSLGDYDVDLPPPPPKRTRPESFVATASNYSGPSIRDKNSPTYTRTSSFHHSESKGSPYQNGRLSAVIKPADPWDKPVANITEAMLLRYFVEDLSRWFDLNDPGKYFRITVPQRARTCQPLMNAVLTASARHLTRVRRYRGQDGIIRYDGRELIDLTTETALHYHNDCIKDLINSSTGLNSMGTEDFLAAAIILRFYEEVDAPLRDEEKDSELFRQMAMAFFKTRPDVSSPDIPTTSPMTAGAQESIAGDLFGQSPTNAAASNFTPRSFASDQLTATADRPHQAPYWVALRQEIHHSFLNQRAFLIPLPKV